MIVTSIERKKKEAQNIRKFAKEITTLPPLLMRHLKLFFLDSGEITPVQLAVILNLKDYSEPVRMNELARIMSSSMPTMTGIIARLVERGYVERGDDPSDRRVVTVKLTPDGEKLARELFANIENLWSNLLVQLNENERKHFVRIVRKMKNILIGEVKV